jgi:phosphoenolpyruvate-protein phosphotransferase
MSAEPNNVKIKGRPMSPGLASGNAFVYREAMAAAPEAYDIERHQVEAEFRRINRAADKVIDDLKVSASRIEERLDAKVAAIFQAHKAILQDPSLRQEIRKEIETELVNGEGALTRVFRRWERRFREMTEEAQHHLADDMADLGRRLLLEMAGVRTTALEMMPEGRVLVARRLLPSDTVAMPRRSVVGIVVETGGPGSHAALLARAMGIPIVGEVPKATELIADDDVVMIDGFFGDVIVRPDEATQAEYRTRVSGLQATMSEARRLCREPARTHDGASVDVMANVGCVEDSVSAAENGADGVGLYRMEQYYLSRKTPPTEEELVATLHKIGEPMKGKPITVRLLDMGGDKPLPFLKLPAEDNPFLGLRGIRLLLRYPDLMTTQLRALLTFSNEHDVRILVPMITLADEMAQVRRRLEELAPEMGVKNIPPLGAMIEVPAAALTILDILKHVDFFGIGTNDLTQYTMAAGRENPLVSDYFADDHPAVLRLIRLVVEEGGGVPIEVCGELASRIDIVPTLLRLGIRALSVAPPLIPGIKEAVRRVELLPP